MILEVTLLSYFCLIKFWRIDGKFEVIIEKCYEELRSYFGESLKKSGKNFIEIINKVVKITEILEKQYVIILWKFRRRRVMEMQKRFKKLENFIQFLEEF